MKNNTAKGFLAAAFILAAAFLFYLGVSACSDTSKKSSGGEITGYFQETRDTFTNCIINSSFNEVCSQWRLGGELHVGRNLDLYKDLNFNAVQSYDEIGSDVYGRPDKPLDSGQIKRYKGFLDSVKNAGLYGFFERSHLSKYIYGQRLIYVPASEKGNTSENFGFVFTGREKGKYEKDGNRNVLHAVPDRNPARRDSGYICRDIFENLQHSDLFDFRQNDKGTWYIKPVMKIPPNMPSSTRVIRIEVIPFGGGKPAKSFDLYAGNFTGGDYSGTYKDPVNELSISGDTKEGDLNYGRNDTWWEWDKTCKVDFRIFWYGECEVWFDKLIVDDDLANRLFDPRYKSEIDFRIKQEAENFSGYGGLYTFFTDEVCISQYPCMKYIIDEMREYNPSARLSLAVTNYLHIHGLRNDALSFRVYIDSLKPAFLQVDHHGFSYDLSRLPAGINIKDGRMPGSWKSGSDILYNEALQNKVFGGKNDVVTNNDPGSFIYEIRKIRNCISESGQNVKFIVQPQLHSYVFCDTSGGMFSNGLREPTNEEIQAQAMLALSHGAKGLSWFIYNSFIWKTEITKKVISFMSGMLNPETGTGKRIFNAYGQDKWKYVSDMNLKIKKWIPALETINWIDGFSVHQNGAGNFFVQEIKSVYRNKDGVFDERNNSDKIKYWEEGFFLPKDKSDKSVFVLFVNRRCVPETNPGAGGIRMLKIKFDAQELNVSGKWKLTDLSSGREIIFDKNNQGAEGFLSLGDRPGDIGYFNPGEGKLFKLEPVQ